MVHCKLKVFEQIVQVKVSLKFYCVLWDVIHVLHVAIISFNILQEKLSMKHMLQQARSRLQPLVCFEEIDRILSNKEKDQLTSMDCSIYNTK